MDIKLYYKDETIKSIKFYKNGKVKKEKYYHGAIVKYDKDGNIIYYKYFNGDEACAEYDEKKNLIYFKVNNIVLLDRRTNKGE